MRLEYEGRFLADIEDYGLYQSKTSQALAVDFFFTTRTYFDRDVQSDYSGYRVRGRFFIIGKTGDVLQEQAAAVADATGWDGDLNVITQETWQPQSPVQIIVEKEESDQGRTYYKAFRILRQNWQPARAGNVNAEDGRLIAARYTSALKSVVSKYRRDRAEDPIPAPAATPPEPKPDPVAADGPWTEQRAWAAFLEKTEGMLDDDIQSVWQEALGFFGDEKDGMTAEAWEQVASIDPKTWTPF